MYNNINTGCVCKDESSMYFETTNCKIESASGGIEYFLCYQVLIQFCNLQNFKITCSMILAVFGMDEDHYHLLKIVSMLW